MDHICQPEPGTYDCFVCGREIGSQYGHQHREVARQYGDETVQECSICGVEWPCPTVKAIKRNAVHKRREAHAAHS
jgi:hypothetical protein